MGRVVIVPSWEIIIWRDNKPAIHTEMLQRMQNELDSSAFIFLVDAGPQRYFSFIRAGHVHYDVIDGDVLSVKTVSLSFFFHLVTQSHMPITFDYFLVNKYFFRAI